MSYLELIKVIITPFEDIFLVYAPTTNIIQTYVMFAIGLGIIGFTLKKLLNR